MLVVEPDEQDPSATDSRSDSNRDIFSSLFHVYVRSGVLAALCAFNCRVDFVTVRANQANHSVDDHFGSVGTVTEAMAIVVRSRSKHAMLSPALTETPRRRRHEIGIGIAHGFATLGTIGFEGRFDYAAIGTVSNVASRLCDEAKPGQILISPRVLTKVENAVKVEPVGEFELKGIRRPLAAYNVLSAAS
jgi:class 3 adenylate cyclase